ncbi:LmbE-like protein [Aulographum hederae CBS 113979]|uniref:N-acetylglucosaminylphosphatidylinositol deacetylase n=1 Tax=Aulographum hederae CBS 113979 TaxID=1176131 RepID=A0A6G1GJZ7_9PEZI|nr:LmbE-like protein [Aulographum hederae CBS 113979]
MTWLFWALPIFFYIGAWILYVRFVRARALLQTTTLHNKRICLLIAHPDDEVMFFAPTVIALTDPALNNHVSILCISNGSGDGDGAVRSKELIKSALMLGIRSKDDITVLDDANFPDSFSVTWNPRLLSNLLTARLAPKMASISANAPPEADVDVLITFDKHGVSAHPNHKSLYHGTLSFLKAIMHKHSGSQWTCPIKLYTLNSTSLVRKYAGIFDPLLTLLPQALGTLIEQHVERDDTSEFPGTLVFLNSLEDTIRAIRAMKHGHESQMMWFRYGYLVASRYMIMNELVQVEQTEMG